MPCFKVLTPDAQYADDAVVERSLSGPQFDWSIYRAQRVDEVDAEALVSCDGMVVWQEFPLEEAVIAKLDRCRVIVRAGVGFDHIDLEATARRGIPVCNVPDYGTAEVADHAIAMATVLARGIVTYHEDLKRDPLGMFDSARLLGQKRLAGSVFATLGIGRIGTAATLRAKAFGLRVVCFDPYAPRGVERALGIERVNSLEDLLEVADILSLHAPLTPETRGIIDAEALARLKEGAILVNTARGGLVEMDALLAALKSGYLMAAGLDVFPEEPIPLERAWYRTFVEQPDWLRGRLLLTPHTAWLSEESRRDARVKAVETLVAYLARGELRNCVNGLMPEQVRTF